MKAIIVENLSKMYRIYDKPSDRLKELFNFRGKPWHKEFWALQGVSFEVEQGEAVGVIGRNGAGKSTLLKLIVGTLEPTTGRVSVLGKISSLLELGSGFNVELSGQENVYLSGMVLGMSRAEIDRKYESIVDFAGLHDFMHLPVKTYSTGMYMRLAFSVAVHVDPEIFVVDEALAVGDMYFIGRCIERIQQICNSGATVLLVSHNLYLVQRLCHRAIWLDHGKVRMIGPANEVCIAYENAIREEQEMLAIRETTKRLERAKVTGVPLTKTASPIAAPAAGPSSETSSASPIKNRIWGSGEMKITKVAMLDHEGRDSRVFDTGRSLTIRIHYQVLCHLKAYPTFYALITRDDGVYVTRAFSDEPFIDFGVIEQEGYIDIIFEPLLLGAGNYLLSVGIFPHEDGAVIRLNPYDFHDRIYAFSVKRAGRSIMTVFDHPVRWHHHASNSNAGAL